MPKQRTRFGPRGTPLPDRQSAELDTAFGDLADLLPYPWPTEPQVVECVVVADTVIDGWPMRQVIPRCRITVQAVPDDEHDGFAVLHHPGRV